MGSGFAANPSYVAYTKKPPRQLPAAAVAFQYVVRTTVS
jgi:hypothetical protein